MTRAAAGDKHRRSAGVLVAGAALIGLSALPAWSRVHGVAALFGVSDRVPGAPHPFAFSIGGLTTSPGRVTLGAGVVVLVVAAVKAAGRGGRWAVGVAMVAALVAAGAVGAWRRQLEPFRMSDAPLLALLGGLVVGLAVALEACPVRRSRRLAVLLGAGAAIILVCSLTAVVWRQGGGLHLLILHLPGSTQVFR